MKAEKISPEKAKEIAEDIVKKVKKDKPATHKDYLKKYDRMIKHGLPFHKFVAQKNYKKASYYAYKAAYQYGLSLSILYNYSHWEILIYEDKEEARHYSDCMSDWAHELIELKSDYTRRHLHENIRSQYQGERRRAVGHRRSIIGLPKDWRQKVIEALLRTKNTHSIHAIVAMLTGCRPQELLNGVKIKYREPGQIEFVIRGAKVTERSGQPTRTLVIDSSQNKFAVNLERHLKFKDGHEMELSIKSKDSFQKAVVRAAKRVGFKKVTPYSFRNQFSADLKSDGWDRVSIAIALGHINDRTQQVYGAVNQGKGGNCLLEVSGDRSVKEVSGSGFEIENRSGRVIDSKTGDIVQKETNNFKLS